MNILEKIIMNKKKYLSAQKRSVPVKELEKTTLFRRESLSFSSFIKDKSKTGIIAEFKRKSPSKGLINEHAEVDVVTAAYTKFGASALSVLTDQEFFGGSSKDLIAARKNSIPILRKDFVIDEYQIIEAKSIGADCILLIAACLDKKNALRLAKIAQNLGLEILLEVHEERELEYISDETDVVGVNNRDLRSFKVDIERSLIMAEKMPTTKIKIAESGISSIENIVLFKKNGFSGFLIGENFMKASNPGEAFESFVIDLKNTSACG
ncbi:MAG TPA: indole-3-glycerol phosphate synthase TrpC [Puia sp.]|nr:indole-3-glycerol phosphate synthase TrpC [Puia sp.]